MMNLRDWPKLQRKGKTQGAINFDISPIVNEMADLYQPIALDKEVAITNYITSPLILRANRNQVRVIVRSLIGTALHYSRSKDKIYMGYEQMPHNAICIKITATGLGLDEALVKTLFEPRLVTVPSSHSQKGPKRPSLVLVKEYASENGGTILVQNHVGAGIMYRFSIPKAS